MNYIGGLLAQITGIGNIRTRNIFIPLLIIIWLVAFDLNAQMKAGYRFGINLTSMSIKKNGINIETQTPVGIQFGAMYEIPFSRKFTMQSGFLFTSKGTDYRIDSTDYSIAPAYIEMPVHAVYYFGRRSFRVSFLAGPYFSSAFGGYKIESNGFQELTLGRGHDKDLRYLDFGFDFGTSLNFKGYVFSIQYGIGLKNTSPKNELIMKNQVIGISIYTLLKPTH